ncbi:MAG: bifunctional phosphopantothenoylcysteine decarboxylase/phosphopantothenate--cysteine ligase CoaBC, partial [Candidatus Actinomarinales bacterium]|nr:bifunctional phosphopantothenoylcysteine decarboxylase/phosphopantothenate--cysteine ligase CoaBC [Candidatus Actinomarinales bacterium]
FRRKLMKKNILLGLTGSIACSKAEQFVQEYKEIYNFKIIATHSSKNYLSDTFLAEHNVISDWDDLNGSPHIDLARFSDSFIIYPATANFIAKINSGIADDLLTSTVLMFNKTIYICPAMHEEMYLNNKTQHNLLELSRDNIILGPRYGNLDIGDIGYGRMIEPKELYNTITKSKEKIIVTSGPTSEPIDDVKVITNNSSGKQGKSIAIELLAKGYEVIYIHSSNISPLPGAVNYSFNTSKELFELMCDESENTKYIFMVAAVSDFTIEKVDGKISRNKGEINIKLQQNFDLIQQFKSQNPHIVCIAFSAQIDNHENFNKLISKNADYLVINNIVENPFGSQTNKIKLINKDKLLLSTGVEDKNIVASKIIDSIIK